jgi:hypothetical protein
VILYITITLPFGIFDSYSHTVQPVLHMRVKKLGIRLYLKPS